MFTLLKWWTQRVRTLSKSIIAGGFLNENTLPCLSGFGVSLSSLSSFMTCLTWQGIISCCKNVLMIAWYENRKSFACLSVCWKCINVLFMALRSQHTECLPQRGKLMMLAWAHGESQSNFCLLSKVRLLFQALCLLASPWELSVGGGLANLLAGSNREWFFRFLLEVFEFCHHYLTFAMDKSNSNSQRDSKAW